ncbi:hypothetical protein VUR80DRAFT_1907 [Thermomyces stellatus]
MEGPKTPTTETPARPDTPIPGNDEHKTPPQAPRLIRTGPLANSQVPPPNDDDDDDCDALFSREQPDESPTLKHNRRQLKATYIDPRYLDRPIARPMGPRPVPQAPQRPKRHRHSEPAGGTAVPEQERDREKLGERALVGPRPLVKSPSVRGCQLDDPFGSPLATPRFTVSIPARVGTDEEGSDCSTPRVSRLNKKRALDKDGDDENARG